MNKTKNKSKKEARHETCWCPFCLCQRIMEETVERHGEFFSHLRNARIEVLRAFQSLLEKRISSLEKAQKKVTKVKVE